MLRYIHFPDYDCPMGTHLRSWRDPPLRKLDVFRLCLVGRHSNIFDSHAGKLQKFVHSGGAVSGCWLSEFYTGSKGLQPRRRNGDCLRLVLLPLAQLAKNWGWFRLRFEVYGICKSGRVKKVSINYLSTRALSSLSHHHWWWRTVVGSFSQPSASWTT